MTPPPLPAQSLDILLHPSPSNNKQASALPFHFGHYSIPTLQALLCSKHLVHWYMPFPNLEFEP